MAIARMRKVVKRIKKKGKKSFLQIFPSASKTPGQVDYPAISKALKRKKKISNAY